MKQNHLLIIIIFLLFLSTVNAQYDVNIPNYLDVNVSEPIKVTLTNNVENSNLYLLLQGILYPFAKSSDGKIFTLNILNSVEEDLRYRIFFVNTTPETFKYHDDTNETAILLTNTSIYLGMREYSSSEHLQGYNETHTVCGYMKSTKGTPIVSAIILYNNGSVNKNSTSILGGLTVTNTAYAYKCFVINQIYYDTMINYTEYFSLKCENCGPSTEVSIGIDTNTTFGNHSYKTTNFSTFTNLTNQNYMIYMIETEGAFEERVLGTLKFRIPYYATIQLYNTKNTTLSTSFDYIYLRNASSNSVKTSTAGIISFTNWLNRKIGTTTNYDYTETFWGQVTGNTATIKLYEAGNYKVSLLSVKTLNPNWGYEFYKPQYTLSTVDTTLDTRLELINKSNVDIKILMSDYEANKSGFIFNYIKWLFFIIVFVALIVLAMMSPNPVAGIMAVIVLFLFTLFLKALGVW